MDSYPLWNYCQLEPNLQNKILTFKLCSVLAKKKVGKRKAREMAKETTSICMYLYFHLDIIIIIIELRLSSLFICSYCWHITHPCGAAPRRSTSQRIHPLVSTLPLSYFITTNYCFRCYYLLVWNWRRRAAMTKTGPNDVSASFGPLVSFLFISFSFLLSLTTVIGATSVLEVRNRQRRAAMTKTGPNDARCVVWAISKFFFLSFIFYWH